MKSLYLAFTFLFFKPLFAAAGPCEIQRYNPNSVAVANAEGRQLSTRYRISDPAYDDLVDLAKKGFCEIEAADCIVSFVGNLAYVQRKGKAVSVLWRISEPAYDDLERLIEIGYCSL